MLKTNDALVGIALLHDELDKIISRLDDIEKRLAYYGIEIDLDYDQLQDLCGNPVYDEEI